MVAGNSVGQSLCCWLCGTSAGYSPVTGLQYCSIGARLQTGLNSVLDPKAVPITTSDVCQCQVLVIMDQSSVLAVVTMAFIVLCEYG